MEERTIELVKDIRNYAIISRAQIADLLKTCQDYLDWVAEEQDKIAEWHHQQNKEKVS